MSGGSAGGVSGRGAGVAGGVAGGVTPATPLMQQYRDIKVHHPDSILFFRMGDFYETFGDDAVTASRALGITLTSRNNGNAADVPLAGVPVKAVGEYVKRLVRQGFRVAICEQVEDPKLAKGIVRREVVETVTPGAAFSDDILDGARNNFLCAVHAAGAAGAADGAVGVAAADVSTGEFRLALVPRADAGALLARLAPRELIVARAAGDARAPLPNVDGALVTERDAWEFDAAMARDDLSRQFGVLSLDGLGLGESDAAAVGAAGALLRYLRELQPAGVPHLARPVVERAQGVMPLDEMTRRNLELVESLRHGASGGTEGTLLGVLDRTLTPMGARLLRQWLLAPLVDRAAVVRRHDAVAAFVADPLARAAMRDALDGVRDVERLASKAAAGRANPRELRALGDSMARLPLVETTLTNMLRGERGGRRGSLSDAPSALHAPPSGRAANEPALPDENVLLTELRSRFDSCADLSSELARSLVARPPTAVGEEATIAPGVDAELDELRALRDGGKDAIAGIQAAERERTGITSLKVGYNRVFGYFIEVTHANSHLVPGDYQRRQTLTGAERYVTPALKEYEERVLTASDRIEVRERELFEGLRSRVGGDIRRLQCVAQVLAELDVLATFAEVADREGYVRPEVTDGYDLAIVAGRHPVVERMMPREKFIPNDVTLTEEARLVILTGPNMAGKSTVLRQIGLIVLLAQVGSFVPASRATVGIVDRLFTRVGASDNLVRGQSTFMVEMAETSAILHTATRRSLVLLDEIGRGTSTYDGVSIAWSVSEHVHDAIGCKTVFATHYHELTQLADELSGVRNFNVAVREVGDEVLFLHRLQPGGANRSYGIEVGRLAGLPAPVLARAREVLALLEGEHLVEGLEKRVGGRGSGVAVLPRRASTATPDPRPSTRTPQLALFAAEPDPVVQRLREVDPNTLTPLQALALLAELVAEAQR